MQTQGSRENVATLKLHSSGSYNYMSYQSITDQAKVSTQTFLSERKLSIKIVKRITNSITNYHRSHFLSDGLLNGLLV